MSQMASDERGEIDVSTENQIEFIDPEELIGFEPAEGLDLGEYEKKEEDINKKIVVNEPKKIDYEITQNTILEKREDTRGRLALIYTLATFFFFALGLVVAIIDGLNRDVSIVDNMEKVIPLMSGVFLGTLGFVLGYYFRKSDE